MKRLLTFAATALLAISSATSVSAAGVILTEFRWAANPDVSDIYADGGTPINPPAAGRATTDLFGIGTATVNSGIFNYVNTAAGINSSIVSDGSIVGPGLSSILQNKAEAPVNYRLRKNARRLNSRAGSGSNGSTGLFYLNASAPSLDNLRFDLSMGPGSQNYQDGLRFALQDTSNDWWLSDFSTGNDAEGLHSQILSSLQWAAYTPATTSSSTLANFIDGQPAPTFSTFSGAVQAFGIFYEHDGDNSSIGGSTDVQYRTNGFRVVTILGTWFGTRPLCRRHLHCWDQKATFVTNKISRSSTEEDNGFTIQVLKLELEQSHLLKTPLEI